ncbi:MAG TPA: hypothetical protein V6D28_12925 [Leptolyngbyaceae cyanobacterium]
MYNTQTTLKFTALPVENALLSAPSLKIPIACASFYALCLLIEIIQWHRKFRGILAITDIVNLVRASPFISQWIPIAR